MARDKEEVSAMINAGEKRFSRWEEAERLWNEGDVAAATEKAFGVDPDTYAARNIKHKMSRNPEVERLKERLDRQEREAEELEEQEATIKRQAEEHAAQQAQAQAIEQEKDRLFAEVAELEAYKDFTEDDNGWFKNAVFHEMALAVTQEGEDIDAEEAAERAVNRAIEGLKSTPKRRRARLLGILSSLDEHPDQPGSEAATPAQDGSTPARRRPKQVSPQRAQVTAEKKLTFEQLKRQTARQMREMYSQ